MQRFLFSFLYRIFFLLPVSSVFNSVHGQDIKLTGIVKDGSSGEKIANASITIFTGTKITGTVTNAEGNFSISVNHPDSLKISMIGYKSARYLSAQVTNQTLSDIRLQKAPAELAEVVVHPLPASSIIQKAIEHFSSNLALENFEDKGFYREVIRDRDHYFSVAEALFTAQYQPAADAVKLRMDRGRSKEDVSYTRLFEDFHPAGGPQMATDAELAIAKPTFLNKEKLKDYRFRTDSLSVFNDHTVYCISFDQLPGLHEALDKGTIYIDAENFAVVKYVTENSPAGTPYIKSLTGSDKIMAKLLHIDLERKGWKRNVDFTEMNGKWMLSHVEFQLNILYKQPKKNIDLDLHIDLELLMSELQLPVTKAISSSEEWKRKNLIINLPTAFDPAFWGNSTTLSPTTQLSAVIAGISQSNKDLVITDSLNNWQYTNRNSFVAYPLDSGMLMIPVMKSRWEDGESGGMLSKEMTGDFRLETRIVLKKNSDSLSEPDKGFQQAGLMIREPQAQSENYFFLALGTGGNPNAKLFFRKTTEGKSKTVIQKTDGLSGWLRLEKKGNKIFAWFRKDETAEWQEAGDAEASWMNRSVEAGTAVCAGFTAQGPKMHPDMKAYFSPINFITL